MNTLKYLLFILLIAIIGIYPENSRAASSVQLEITRASLLSEQTAIVPGKPIRMGVLLEPKEHWHTYWENPGDAGIPTSMEWSLPEGFTASGIDWPAPQPIKEGPLLTHSYVGNVFLPVTITPPAELSGSVTLRVKASWLVCIDICIPESAELDLELPVADSAAPSESAALFSEHTRNRPVAVAQPATYHLDEKRLTLWVPVASLDTPNIKRVRFMPRQENVIVYSADQLLTVKDGTLQLSLERSGTTAPTALSGLLRVQLEEGEKYFDLQFNTAAAPAVQPKTMWLPVLLLFALIGGLILNLMPCVLPVLSLKALAIARKSGAEHVLVMRQGLAYTLGILVSFATFGGVLISLKAGGEAVGWGYQMQSPAFVGFLIYLLFLVGLSLSGLFHLPVLLGSIGSKITSEDSPRGSFLTGILATAVATPCTAPFMASAIGAALSLPAWQTMLVFETLGLGLALPFLLLSFWPAMLRFLPKPGAWMDRFKELLAFPMYASVIWLLWVLTLQTGAGGMVIAACGMLIMVIAIWMRMLFKHSHLYRVSALTIFVLVIGLSLPMLSRMEIGTVAMPGIQTEQKVTTVPYSKTTLAELRAAAKPVYVDATAAWCITCQVNARVALHTSRTVRVFNEKGVVLMIADWTRRNPEITEFLSSFGYQGVPLNVYYPPNGEPRILPQLLTESIVIDTITR